MEGTGSLAGDSTGSEHPRSGREGFAGTTGQMQMTARTTLAAQDQDCGGNDQLSVVQPMGESRRRCRLM